MSRSEHLVLPRQFYNRMVQHAQAELPNECCGLLAGVREGNVLCVKAWYPLVNEAASPVEYLSEPRSMFQATKAMRGEGYDIVAIYHSHPTSAPTPSKTDLARSCGWDVVNFILGLSHFFFLFPHGKRAYLVDEPPITRGWWLTDNAFEEAAWEIVEP